MVLEIRFGTHQDDQLMAHVLLLPLEEVSVLSFCFCGWHHGPLWSKSITSGRQRSASEVCEVSVSFWEECEVILMRLITATTGEPWLNMQGRPRQVQQQQLGCLSPKKMPWAISPSWRTGSGLEKRTETRAMSLGWAQVVFARLPSAS